MEIPTLNLNHLIFLIYLITFISQVHLLYRCLTARRGEKLTPPIMINMVAWLLKAGFGIGIFSSMAIFMVPTTNRYFLYCNTVFVALSGTLSTSVAFLQIDRLIVIKYPTQHRDHRTLFAGVMIGSCCFASLFVGTLFFATSGATTDEDCSLFCGIKALGFLVLVINRLIFGPVNLILGLMLAFVLWRYASTTKQHRQFRKANILTVLSLVVELITNFLPNVLMFGAVWIFHYELGSLLAYTSLLLSLDGLITVLLYRFVILARIKSCSSTKSVISTVTTTA